MKPVASHRRNTLGHSQMHVPRNGHTLKGDPFIVKRTFLALAATSIDVPVVASAPSLDPKAPTFGGAVATLSWDATNAQKANEPATVHVTSDSKYLYVRFDAPQSEPLIGAAGGDSVAIDLWPSGSTGDRYRLGIELTGSHTADSTANTASWEGAAVSHPGGYTVTMKIPTSALAGSSNSQVQFSRWISSTATQQVWSHGSPSSDDVGQAGTMTLTGTVGKN